MHCVCRRGGRMPFILPRPKVLPWRQPAHPNTRKEHFTMRYAKLSNSYMVVGQKRVSSDPTYKAKITADVAGWMGPSRMRDETQQETSS